MSAPLQTFPVSTILDRINNSDRDINHQGLLDLNGILKNENFKLTEPVVEQKIVNAILDKIKDQSGTIQGLATNCLGSLCARGIKEPNLERICVQLLDLLLGMKPEERSVGANGLKAVIADTPFSSAPTVCRVATERLVDGLSVPDKQLVSLETLIELVRRFGSFLQDFHVRIQNALLRTLETTKQPTIRRKSIACIALLACHLSKPLFDQLLALLIDQVGKAKKKEEKRLPIQLIGSISRSVGYRAGHQLSQLVPLLISALKSLGDDNVDAEIRECCIEACQSFVLKCSNKDLNPHLPAIVSLCLENIAYDPNYQVDEEEEEEEEDEDEDEISDDEDMSWKSRRAAVRCLGSIIRSHPELLPTIFQKVAPTLISRIKEREEHVRLDVFATLTELLAQCARCIKLNIHDCRALLQPHLEPLMKVLLIALKSRGPDTKAAVVALLKDLAAILPGSLGPYFGTLFPIIDGLWKRKDTTTQLRTGILELFELLFSTHPHDLLDPHLRLLVPLLIKASADSYYKLSAQGLRAMGALTKTIRPPSGTAADVRPHAKPCFDAVLVRLQQQDQDQEVKHAAIAAMATLVASMGDFIEGDVQRALPILLDRCRNEIMRPSAVRAVQEIASSWLRVDLRPILADLLSEFARFLRMSNRALVQGALETLATLVRSFGGQMQPAQLQAVMTEAGHLVCDRDLHLAELALNLIGTTLEAQPAALSSAKGLVLPNVMGLLQSSLLQGTPLQAVLHFFGTLIRLGDSPQAHLDALLASIGPSTPRHACSSIAQTIGAIARQAGGGSAVQGAVRRFVGDLRSPSSDKLLLALLCLGDIGRQQDLSGQTDLKETVLSKLDAPQEEIQMAAAYCLGNLAVGSLSQYLCLFFDLLDKKPAWQYFLLHSIKEVIIKVREPAALDPFVEQILGTLLRFLGNDNEGIRNTAAECLGRLALLRPESVVGALEKATGGSSATRCGICHAVKHSIVDTAQPVDKVLQDRLASFLSLLRDADLGVKRAALQMLNAVVHAKPHLVREVLPQFWGAILEETQIKAALRKTVEMGPFKEIVDMGLPVRKAAFEALDTILRALPDLCDLPLLVRHLIPSLNEDFDVSMRAQAMLAHVAGMAVEVVLAQMDGIVPQLAKALEDKTKVISKTNVVKQDVEKAEDLMRSVLRVAYTIEQLPAHEQSAIFMDFLNKTVKQGIYKPRYDTVVAEKDQKQA